MPYQSMSRIRFSSPDSYERFRTVFAQTDAVIETMPGFLHRSWWHHSSDPLRVNEVSFWMSEEDIHAWLVHPYNQKARQWAAKAAAVMEVLITDFELKSTLLVRLCPTCGDLSEVPYDLAQERALLARPCSCCGFDYPA